MNYCHYDHKSYKKVTSKRTKNNQIEITAARKVTFVQLFILMSMAVAIRGFPSVSVPFSAWLELAPRPATPSHVTVGLAAMNQEVHRTVSVYQKWYGQDARFAVFSTSMFETFSIQYTSRISWNIQHVVITPSCIILVKENGYGTKKHVKSHVFRYSCPGDIETQVVTGRSPLSQGRLDSFVQVLQAWLQHSMKPWTGRE